MGLVSSTIAALRVLLVRLDVFLDHVDALYGHFIFTRMRSCNLTSLALILTGADNHFIALLELDLVVLICSLQYLRCQRHNLSVALVAQLTRDGSEYAGRFGLLFIVNYYGRVVIEFQG